VIVVLVFVGKLLLIVALSFVLAAFVCFPIILCELFGYECPYCGKVHVVGWLNRHKRPRAD